MTISNQKAVLIHYTLKNVEGDILDSSAGREPLAYLHGAGNIIEGLENSLSGKQAGDKLQVTVEPAEAYGEYDESLVQEVPLSAFEGMDTLEPGMQFHAEGPFGPQIVTITAVAEETVVVDANAPLAGETLHFDVEIVEVREATDDELEHGHIHGEGCDHSYEEEAVH